MKNILIIGCGLIGSSLLRSIVVKKIAKKIFVYEKSKSNIIKIKKLKLPCEVISDFKKIIPNVDLIIFCTPLSEYEKIINAMNVIKPPFNVNQLAQIAATEALKDKNFINQSVKHNIIEANQVRNILEKLNISSNEVTANFLLLNFDKCKFSANYVFTKLQSKGIILRSTEDGYNIKNKLRLTIGSKKENAKFIKEVKVIFN